MYVFNNLFGFYSLKFIMIQLFSLIINQMIYNIILFNIYYLNKSLAII